MEGVKFMPSFQWLKRENNNKNEENHLTVNNTKECQKILCLIFFQKCIIFSNDLFILLLQKLFDSSCHTLPLQEPDHAKKRNTAAISGLVLPSFYFAVLIEPKSIYVVLWVMNSFPPYNSFPINRMFQASYYSTAIAMENIQTRCSSPNSNLLS